MRTIAQAYLFLAYLSHLELDFFNNIFPWTSIIQNPLNCDFFHFGKKSQEY